ncbi:alpha-2,8-polysialyltransferase family protein [Amnibacterium soli]|uniref:Alpha-2,8-polysialyltransferase family protein n=1 Tax=Amnibacterium soli TaxID=1282736 RepID=A0ABP8ZEE5_9MICO
MRHVFEVSTGFGLCGVAAIVEHLDLGAVEDRVLLVANTVLAFEAAPPVHELPEYAPLLALFGRVVHLNDLIAPEHPHGWSPVPGSHHARLATAQLHAACGIDPDEEHVLWVESIQGAASASLTRLFERARIAVYADGLMTYGPTRIGVPDLVGDRIDAVVHLDLVPGLQPFVLREFHPEYRSFPIDGFLDVLRSVGGVDAPPVDGPVSVVVGQYLADLGLLTQEEDAALLSRMIAVALEQAPDRPVLVRAHPKAAAHATAAVVASFTSQGRDVRLLPTRGLVETLFAELDVALVVSCFSTALFTARAMGVPTVAVGARAVLRRLRPYQNSNRMAIVLADLLHLSVPLEAGPAQRPTTDPALIELIAAVTALSMQPGSLEGMLGVHDAAVLALPPDRYALLRRYVSQERLLRLFPGLPAPRRSVAARMRGRAARVPVLRGAWRAARRARTALAGPGR